ncbi:MAG: hypothetical protein A4E65_01582 [Syntrophorhabdus sp. PtaU1.Bin153]|nr:MAG: hypothetical protein A4E65_01582 [Syntrophorhabdus sp. PtaU1.Bin153]
MRELLWVFCSATVELSTVEYCWITTSRGRARTERDKTLSGSDLIEAIIRNVSTDVPILVHSMNPKGASARVERLECAGFSVDRIPMFSLTKELLLKWLDETGSTWED